MVHLRAAPWGRIMMGLRDLSAIRILNIAVEVGLVMGVMAKMGPMGRANSTMPFSGSSEMLPTVFRSLMSS